MFGLQIKLKALHEGGQKLIKLIKPVNCYFGCVTRGSKLKSALQITSYLLLKSFISIYDES